MCDHNLIGCDIDSADLSGTEPPPHTHFTGQTSCQSEADGCVIMTPVLMLWRQN